VTDQPTPFPNPRNSDQKGRSARGSERLLAQLEARPPATVHTVGELGAILDNMPLVSIGPDGLGGELQHDETGRPVPASYVPESRYPDIEPIAERCHIPAVRCPRPGCPGFMEQVEPSDNGCGRAHPLDNGAAYARTPGGVACDCCGHFIADI
jgi:hypothetical protein